MSTALLTVPVRALNIDVSAGKFIIPLTFAWSGAPIKTQYPIITASGYDCNVTSFDLSQVNTNYQLPNIKQIAGIIDFGAPSGRVCGPLFIRLLNTQQVIAIGTLQPNTIFQMNIVSFSIPVNTVVAQGTSNLEFCKVVDSANTLFGNAQLSLLTYNEQPYITQM